MSYEPAIQVQEIAKHYLMYESPAQRMRELLFGVRRHTRVSAVQPTSFTIHHGEVVGILGRNGAGKSTLLQMIAGTLTPSQGSVDINGKITALLELGSGFNPEFSGRDNVYLQGSILGLTRKQVTQRLDDILEFADIGQYIDRPLKTYSSGMRVRLAFSTIVSLDPEIIIVDEALSVGDAAFQMKCLRLIDSLKNQGKTFLLVSHSVPQIVSFCTRALVMDAGRVIFDGCPKEAAHIYKATLFPSEQSTLVRDTVEETDAKLPVGGGGLPAVSSETEADKPNVTCAAPSKRKKPAKQTAFVAADSEFRFGNGDAKIESIEIIGRNGQPSRVFVSGDTVRLRLTVRARRTVNKPVFGFRVRNQRGWDVYIANTRSRKLQVNAVPANKIHCVEFALRLALVGGEYFISCGLSEENGADITPLDRRMDVLQLSVVSTDSATGIANLESRFVDAEEAELAAC